MTDLLTNLMYSSLYISLFYTVYLVFFRNQTLFKTSRAYFIMSIIASLILPHITWSVEEVILQTQLLELPNNLIQPVVESTIDYRIIIQTAYLSVTATLLFIFIARLVNVLRVIKLGDKIKTDNYVLLISGKTDFAFSFFNYLVLSKEIYQSEHCDKIIAHELVHINQRHSIDSVLLEIICAIMWFNPLIWMMRISLKTIHEYLADQGVLKAGYSYKTYYSAILEQAFKYNCTEITQNFNSTKLKKRILMMNKNESSTLARIKTLAIIPAIMMVCVLISTKVNAKSIKYIEQAAETELLETFETSFNDELQQQEEEVFLRVEQMPTFQGGDLNNFRTWVQTRLKYPTLAAEKDIQGTVYLTFIVEKNGSVSNVTIARGAHELLDNESARVVNSAPKWEPGKQRGKFVRVKYTLPITFKLNTTNKPKTIADSTTLGLSDNANVLKKAESIIFKAFGDNNSGEMIVFNPTNDPDLNKLNNKVNKYDGGRVVTIKVLIETQAEYYSRTGEKQIIQPKEHVQISEGMEEVFLRVEKMPTFQGGDLNTFRNWVQSNIKYPVAAATKRTQGTVYATFIVNSKGDVSNIAIIRGQEDGLNEEVIRVLSSAPKWVAGMQKGKNVSVKYTLPISFKLS